MFMHIKAPDENVLAQLIPEVWWDAKVPCTCNLCFCSFLTDFTNDTAVTYFNMMVPSFTF